MQLRQVFYVSRAAETITAADVREILGLSRRNNMRRDVTGCLLFSGRYFGQVLEGRPEAVESTIKRIQIDDRHDDLRLVCDLATTRRRYDAWSMGYLHDLGLEDRLKGLLTEPVSSSSVVAVLSLLQPDTVMGALR